MLIAISLPIWLAALICLLVGVVGTFSDVGPRGARVALAMLPDSSGLFYVAARMCGLV
jgi:hypothetical protein